MPDILIRGMEMPTGELNYREIQVWSDGTVCVRKGLAGSMQQTDAKAVELPPHGDLIDRDAIVAHYRECERNLGSDRHLEFLTAHDWIEEGIVYDLLNAPVVVPAERREEDG